MRTTNIIVLTIISLLASSCMHTYHVPTAESFREANAQIAASLVNDGYQLSGLSSDVKNEPRASVSTSNSGSEIDNHYVTYDSYTFTNSIGETVSYTTKYAYKKSIHGEVYLKEMNLTECKVSNPNNFQQYCHTNGTVKHQLEASRRDVRDLNLGQTLFLSLCVLIAGGLAMFVMSIE